MFQLVRLHPQGSAETSRLIGPRGRSTSTSTAATRALKPRSWWQNYRPHSCRRPSEVRGLGLAWQPKERTCTITRRRRGGGADMRRISDGQMSKERVRVHHQTPTFREKKKSRWRRWTGGRSFSWQLLASTRAPLFRVHRWLSQRPARA